MSTIPSSLLVQQPFSQPAINHEPSAIPTISTNQSLGLTDSLPSVLRTSQAPCAVGNGRRTSYGPPKIRKDSKDWQPSKPRELAPSSPQARYRLSISGPLPDQQPGASIKRGGMAGSRTKGAYRPYRPISFQPEASPKPAELEIIVPQPRRVSSASTLANGLPQWAPMPVAESPTETGLPALLTARKKPTMNEQEAQAIAETLVPPPAAEIYDKLLPPSQPRPRAASDISNDFGIKSNPWMLDTPLTPHRAATSPSATMSILDDLTPTPGTGSYDKNLALLDLYLEAPDSTHIALLLDTHGEHKESIQETTVTTDDTIKHDSPGEPVKPVAEHPEEPESQSEDDTVPPLVQSKPSPPQNSLFSLTASLRSPVEPTTSLARSSSVLPTYAARRPTFKLKNTFNTPAIHEGPSPTLLASNLRSRTWLPSEHPADDDDVEEPSSAVSQYTPVDDSRAMPPVHEVSIGHTSSLRQVDSVDSVRVVIDSVSAASSSARPSPRYDGLGYGANDNNNDNTHVDERVSWTESSRATHLAACRPMPLRLRSETSADPPRQSRRPVLTVDTGVGPFGARPRARSEQPPIARKPVAQVARAVEPVRPVAPEVRDESEGRAALPSMRRHRPTASQGYMDFSCGGGERMGAVDPRRGAVDMGLPRAWDGGSVARREARRSVSGKGWD